MELVIKKSDLIEKLNNAMKEFDQTYAKTLKLYAKKLEEYTEYVKRNLDRLHEPLRNPPYMPSCEYNEFIKNLRSLEAHQEATLKMSDDEYNAVLDGISHIRHRAGGAMTALEAESYLT